MKSKAVRFYFQVTDTAVHGLTINTQESPKEILSFFVHPYHSVEDLAAILKKMASSVEGSRPEAYCTYLPNSRFLHYFTTDKVARVKTLEGLVEVAGELKIDLDKNKLLVLRAKDGVDYDPAQAVEKELIFCGASYEELNAFQDMVTNSGFYPANIELTTLSSVGLIAEYSQGKKVETPILVLEITAKDCFAHTIHQGKIGNAKSIPFGVDHIVSAVQETLQIDKESSARDLLFSNSVDFSQNSKDLIQPLIKEIQAFIGYYEVQTGQSVEMMVVPGLSTVFDWLRVSLVDHLGLAALDVDYEHCLEKGQYVVADGVDAQDFSDNYLSLVGLL